ncbi:MAG: FCD domain-containing protein [Trueperaceae bacterium]
MADALIRTVRSGRYQAGDRLPTVIKLAESYGVAVHTVREALNQVETLGLIDIRHGAGIFVAERAHRLLFGNPYNDRAGLRRSLELLETRLHLEPPLAAAAARNAPDERLDAVAALLREAEPHLDGSDAANERLNEINLAFHRDVARASGNDVAADVVEVLARLYSDEQLALLPVCEAQIENYSRFDHEGHRGILAALRDRDPERAQELMRRHVHGVQTIVAAHAARHPDPPDGPTLVEGR